MGSNVAVSESIQGELSPIDNGEKLGVRVAQRIVCGAASFPVSGSGNGIDSAEW
jgi:hypothetical protein